MAPVSEKEQVELNFIGARLESLMLSSKKLTTVQNHKRIFRLFSTYMSSSIGRPALDATPQHVVGFLMSRDSQARTLVHVVTCPHKSETKSTREACKCKTRVAAASISTMVGQLTACFDNVGRSGEWSPLHLTGNPCLSRPVRLFYQATKKEQLDAGVKVRQAPVFHVTAFNRMLEYCLLQAQLADSTNDRLTEFSWIQLALMFSLLYCSLNRGVNIAQLRWGQLVEMTNHTGSPALFMHASMGKTGGLSDTRQLIYLPYDGMAALGTFSTLQLYRLFMRATEHSEVPYATRTGFMFRKRLADPAEAFPTEKLASGLREVTAALAMTAWNITIHSFRASGAIAAVYAGLPVDLVMYIGGWSDPDMFDYYTLCRQMMGMPEDVADAVVESAHSGPARPAPPSAPSTRLPSLSGVGTTTCVATGNSSAGAVRGAASAVALPKL